MATPKPKPMASFPPSTTTTEASTRATILAPDIDNFRPPDLPPGAKPIYCCPPKAKKIIDFKPPQFDSMRVRRAAHLAFADQEYLAKFSEALSQMKKKFSEDDPRSFKQQAKVHCTYCNGGYRQVGFSQLEFQIHNSWLFFPFHRYLLYFFERILGSLIGDPSFAIPFWNWDSPNGMQMPAMFVDPKSPLYDKLRNARHQPPTLVDLDYNKSDPSTTDDQQKKSNLAVMYRQMVSGSNSARLFLGSPYRAGDNAHSGAGCLELVPHNTLHNWCGDPENNYEDMGTFCTAGRDPIFYGHHANVDRMWTIWKKLGGKRQDFTDPDWLNAEFVFCDENAQSVRVKVMDCLDTRTLGYIYEDVPIPWLNTRPTPRGYSMAADTPSTATDVFPKKLDNAVRVMVPRPQISRSKKEKDDEEEILVIEGIEVDRDVFVKFDVLINNEHEVVIGPNSTEFAGSFVNLPYKDMPGKKIRTILRLGITELLEELGADDDHGVLVTLVPKNGAGAVTIGGVKIEFDS